MREKVKISIVTVCFNAVDSIEETLLSVLNQTYDNIEYIIIDGGSTDGTVDIIKKYSDRLAYWVSEPDKGIYDAMNKGIDIATGDYVIFINSGDVIYSKESLFRVFSDGMSIEDDVIYGDIIYKYKFGKFHVKPRKIELMPEIFPFFHPASFVKHEVLKKYKFDLRYQIIADYALFYTLYKESKSFKYIPITISVFEAENGTSSVNYHQRLKECSDLLGEKKGLKNKIREYTASTKYYIKTFVLSKNSKLSNYIHKKSLLLDKRISELN